MMMMKSEVDVGELRMIITKGVIAAQNPYGGLLRRKLCSIGSTMTSAASVQCRSAVTLPGTCSSLPPFGPTLPFPAHHPVSHDSAHEKSPPSLVMRLLVIGTPVQRMLPILVLFLILLIAKCNWYDCIRTVWTVGLRPASYYDGR